MLGLRASHNLSASARHASRSACEVCRDPIERHQHAAEREFCQVVPDPARRGARARSDGDRNVIARQVTLRASKMPELEQAQGS
jgi:hypothetical protein